MVFTVRIKLVGVDSFVMVWVGLGVFPLRKVKWID